MAFSPSKASAPSHDPSREDPSDLEQAARTPIMARWYLRYFHTERGVAGLTENRRPVCRLLWELWLPNYRFSDADYAKTAASFDNPDFVAVVIQSYRHRYGNAAGDPRYADIDARLAERPEIAVPTVVLHGEADGVSPPGRRDASSPLITGLRRHELVPVAGHFLPREAPDAVVRSGEVKPYSWRVPIRRPRSTPVTMLPHWSEPPICKTQP